MRLSRRDCDHYYNTTAILLRKLCIVELHNEELEETVNLLLEKIDDLLYEKDIADLIQLY